MFFGSNKDGQLGNPLLTGGQDYGLERLNLIAKMPSPDGYLYPAFIRTIYPIIRNWISQGKIMDYRVNSTVDEDALMEFDHENGTTYVAQVQFDSSTSRIDEPISLNELSFYENELEAMIHGETLEVFEKRPDLYQDEKGNQGFEFEDIYGQTNLIRVYIDLSDKVHPPR